jgi:YebC/PmpR family DNA-binding regulatory protein
MAGHSKFKNIMHRKGAQDAKRAKRFTKALKEITVAAKEGGTDSASNPRLRHALLQARQLNVPKNNIERAMNKSSESKNYDALRYEAMAPGNIALIVEVLTDNRNRSACAVRTAIQKNGGHMADVAFLFDHVGCMQYTLPCSDLFMEKAIEAGALDFQDDGKRLSIFCSKDHFFAFQDTLIQSCGDPHYAELVWYPKIKMDASDDVQEKVMKIVNALDDIDDVQNVWDNAGILFVHKDQGEASD